MSVSLLSTATLLLYTPLEWDVAHIVPKYEEAVWKMSGVLSPGGVPYFPATQYATTAKTLHLVALSPVVETSLGQISGSHRGSRRPRREGPKPGLLTPHMRHQRVGGLINHLSCSQAIFHVFCFFIVDGTIHHCGFRTHIKTGAMDAIKKTA